MKLHIPISLDKYTLTEAARLMDYIATNPFENVTIITMCEVVAAVTGHSVDAIKKVDIESVKKAFAYIIKSVDRKKQKPPKEVTIQGITYEFNQDLAHKSWSAGRFIDADVIGQEVLTYPGKFIAILYLRKGTQYGDEKLEDRAELMTKHFRGDHYVDVVDFFLQKREQLLPGFMVLQTARSQMLRQKALKIIQNRG
jgi:hypothetical protein